MREGNRTNNFGMLLESFDEKSHDYSAIEAGNTKDPLVITTTNSVFDLAYSVSQARYVGQWGADVFSLLSGAEDSYNSSRYFREALTVLVNFDSPAVKDISQFMSNSF
jgi:hypothetical protein